MAVAGVKDAPLCFPLLCCWNFALFANPFNSRPAVFVWVNERAPDKLLCAPLLWSSGLCIELSDGWPRGKYTSLISAEFPLCIMMQYHYSICRMQIQLMCQRHLTQTIACLCLLGCFRCFDNVYISLFLLSLAKEEKCVPEVSGRAAAVGNSRWVTLQLPCCSECQRCSFWDSGPFFLCVCGGDTLFAKTYRKLSFCVA